MAGMTKQGHPHANLMAQYAEDAKISSEPWELWQIKGNNKWISPKSGFHFNASCEYRRKPKTKLVNGTSVPDISFIPEQEENYYFPNIDHPELYGWDFYYRGSHSNEMHVKGNRCYPYTDEGKQAAILHAKAMLGIDPIE